MAQSEDYDVFLSHAWEDKEALVRPLADALVELHLRVWYDEFSLDIGDGLRASIDKGLASSRFGVVVLSPAFFAKQWPAWELNGLVQKAMGEGRKVVLPVWHEVDRAQVAEFSLPLADILAADSRDGVESVADSIARVVLGAPQEQAAVARGQSEQRLLASLKGLIADPNQLVAVNDLAEAVARETYAALSELYAENALKTGSLEAAQALGEQRRAVQGLAKICALGSNLGHAAHQASWERALAIIARDPGRDQEKRLGDALWQYPIVYVLYAAGLAALQRRRLDVAAAFLLGVRVDSSGGRGIMPLVQAIRWEQVAPFVKEAHEEKWRTPLSEDLFQSLKDVVLDRFVDDAEYDRTFDLFEFALALSHIASAPERGYPWAPPARYFWKHEWDAEGLRPLAAELSRQGAVNALFGGNEAAFNQAVELILEMASKRSY